MGKPFDLSKFRRGITKSIEGISVGFHDPKTWISTGNFALNYLISGKFEAGIPLGKVTVFAGQPASGKSLVVSGNIIKHAQDMGIYVILVDTENALDEPWLQAFGVDTSEDKLLKLSLSMINDVGKLLSDFIKSYREDDPETRPKILFVIDSLGMLLSPSDVAQFEKGDMKGDMGIKPKQLKALVKNVLNQFADLDIGLVATNHTYASQDPYSPDDIVSGGSGFIFAASIVVAMKPLKLKEDEDGVKGTKVLGIRSGCKIMKTRYNQPFTTTEVVIPYDQGMLPYSGLFELFEEQGLLTKEGNSYCYTDNAGKVHKAFRKKYLKNEDGILDLIMSEYNTEQVRPNLTNPQLLEDE
jgi:recombination protein RecA